MLFAIIPCLKCCLLYFVFLVVCVFAVAFYSSVECYCAQVQCVWFLVCRCVFVFACLCLVVFVLLVFFFGVLCCKCCCCVVVGWCVLLCCCELLLLCVAFC